MSSAPGRPLILVTGASGYVGGRLVRILLAAGFRVRCLARRPDELRGRLPGSVEMATGDLMKPETLPAALSGVHAVFFLVQSLGIRKNFARLDEQGARNFALAAYGAGITRIVYLSALADQGPAATPHVASRHAVGRILRECGVTTIELRSPPILGSGSVTFELALSLAERQPLLVLPPWARRPMQPIAIGDVLDILVRAVALPIGGSTIFEIGGSEVVTFGGVLREISRQRQFHRFIVPLPFVGTWLSSLALGFTTQVPARVARGTIAAMSQGAVIRDASARRTFGLRPKPLSETIAAALRNEDREFPETRWCLSTSSVGEPKDWGSARFGTRRMDQRADDVPVPGDALFAMVRRIGGNTGWHALDWLWDLRGLIDLALGGVSMRRGRRDPENLVVGDIVDCWRVEAIEPGKRLLLRSELKLPGRAWLEFRVERKGEEASRIKQTALFEPAGLSGLVYWYALWPIHQVVFQGLLEGLGVAARESWRRRKEALKRGADPKEADAASRTASRKQPDARERR